jgi:hypothetical protein
MAINKKRVVYLFGAGASQAEASLESDSVSLLMSNIKDGIYKKISNIKTGGVRELINELAGENVDVEQLITLYESSGNKKHKRFSKLLKKYFREEIQEQISKLDKGGRFSPNLYSALIDMHEIEDFDEELMGIMTLNYEDLIERAVKRVKGAVNYSFELTKTPIGTKIDGILVLKLHGSFNWRNEFPISLRDNIKEEEDILWIPPGVEKHREKYPFNIIWGKAQELLDCDILRIVGCSLSQNDWHLVSLLYTTQKLNRNAKEYIIEIINCPLSEGEETREIWGEEDISKKYPHLRIKQIYELQEIREFVLTSLYKLAPDREQIEIDNKTISNYLAKSNVFDIWLRAKGEDIKSRGIKLTTSSNIFNDYIEEA